MSRKANLEDTVLNYFFTAELPAAKLMLRIVSGTVKRREGSPLPVIEASRKARKQAEQEKAHTNSPQGRAQPELN